MTTNVTTGTSGTVPTGTMTITEHELQQVDRANATGLQPVVFVHGLWLLPSSWDRWAAVFEEAGFTALTPGWPDDPQTRGPAHVRAVPVRVRQRRQRGGGQGALRDLRRAGVRGAPLSGRDRQPQSMDRGAGRHREP